jgi:hypothetical protein
MLSQSTGRFAHDKPLNGLPFDVLSEIVSYIKRRDLAHLCLISSTFLSIFRPLLYREVVFDGRRSWIPTLDLLARDKALASTVVQLDFSHRCDPNPERRPILNLVAVANLTSLRRFQFSGGIFRTEAEESQFWRILSSKMRIPLEQITYRPCVSNPPRLWYGDQYGGLGGLKVVKWSPWSIGRASTLASSLHSLMLASRRRPGALLVCAFQVPPDPHFSRSANTRVWRSRISSLG